MSDVLVTGATGFLGRALVRELVRLGHEPLALVRRASAAAELAAVHGRRVRAREVDLGDPGAVRRALSGIRPSLVFHLAGGRATSSTTAIQENLHSNLAPTVALLSALEKAGVDSFVLASTGEAYGKQPGPFHEDLPTMPQTPYAAAKVAAEAAVSAAHGASGFPGIVARLSVVYGPGPWSGAAAGMLVPRVLEAARAGRAFRMTPGDQTRDFLYVDDAARALVRLAETPEARGRIVNVGAGRSHPVGEVARRLLAELGDPIALELGAVPHGPSEIMDYRFDVTRLRALTGFEPEVSLEEGLRETARTR
jgi:UDP-glucose 4-epimerase